MTDKNEQAKKENRKLQKQFLMGNVVSVIAMNGLHSMGSDEKSMAEKEALETKVQSYRGEVWNQLKEEAKRTGNNYEVGMPTNYELVRNSIKAVAEAQQMLNLGDLYEVLNNIHKVKDIKIPEKLRRKGLEHIMVDLKKVGMNPNELDGESRDIYLAHEALTGLYKKKATELAYGSNNGRDEISLLNSINEKYSPKEKESKK